MIIEIHDIIEYQDELISETGGDKGILNYNLIESSVLNAYQTFGGEELYPIDIDKISIIVYGLINNHGFVDGNKRVGILCLLIMLDNCDIKIKSSDDELVRLGLDIASGKYDKNEVKIWIENRIK
jgi:death on curing protein